jgi:N-acetylglucosamine-6-sulfatase
MTTSSTARRRLSAAGLIAVATAVLAAASLPIAVAAATSSADGSTASTDAPAATSASAPAGPAASTTPARASRAPQITNVVFVLADDLDWQAFDEVPRLRALKKQAVTMNDFVVTESLCCPSRSSILTSQYVHSHGVLSNVAPSIDPSVAETLRANGQADALVAKGGWQAFAQNGHEQDCLPTWLHAAGVRTGFLGKYLNGYGSADPLAVPPGWDEWFVPVTTQQMYRGYGFTANHNGRLRSYPAKTRDFLPDLLTRKAIQFIRTSTGPFYLQVNPTQPHAPYPIAKRHENDPVRATIPQTANFNTVGAAAPKWRSYKKKITGERLATYTRIWRERIRSAESVADSVDAIRAELHRTGRESSTLLVVGSDNGFHIGNHRLSPGKRTPYREDTVVPYLFIGPGLHPGTSNDAVASTIDLGPTFAELLGAATPSTVEGRSLVGLLASGDQTGWRSAILTESLGDTALGDPDYTAFRPPKFHALRTKQWLYVEYETGARELFDLRRDPAETRNVVDSTPVATVAALAEQLHALSNCTGEQCRVADGGGASST